MFVGVAKIDGFVCVSTVARGKIMICPISASSFSCFLFLFFLVGELLMVYATLKNGP